MNVYLWQMSIRQRWFMMKRWVSYYCRAKPSYNIESSLLRDWVTEVWDDQRHFYEFDQIQAYRENLLHRDDIWIDRPPIGAAPNEPARIKLSIMVARQSTPARYGKALFKCAQWADAKHLLELGTSVGIGSAYLAMPNSKSSLVTIEGNRDSAQQAHETFRQLNIDNVLIINGLFQDVLKQALSQLPSVDVVFIDGHHDGASTIRYFEQILPKAHARSVFIFDDINWSKDMYAAWQYIRSHPSVRASVDLYRMGVVFFQIDTDKPQHHVVIARKLRPFA